MQPHYGEEMSRLVFLQAFSEERMEGSCHTKKLMHTFLKVLNLEGRRFTDFLRKNPIKKKCCICARVF
jgi:hypothetical protein